LIFYDKRAILYIQGGKRARQARYFFTSKQTNIMNTCHQSGSVEIAYDASGMHVSIEPEQPLVLNSRSQPKRAIIHVMTALVLAGSFLLTPNVTNAASYTGAELVTQTNAVRATAGLSALHTSSVLETAAREKANDMLNRQYFSHYGPQQETPWTFFKTAGYSFTSAGENLAMDYMDGADIVPAWMASASHRSNLLSAAYQDIGIAVVDGTMHGSPTTIVVQFFGSRTAAQPVIATPKPVEISVQLPKPTTQPTVAKPKVEVAAPVTTPEAKPITSTTEPVIEPVVNLEPLPVAEVRGVSTEVIHTTITGTMPGATFDPRITALIMTTFGLYVTILAGFGTLQRQARQSEDQELPALAPSFN
jgi:uncharacterized protein YkwD